MTKQEIQTLEAKVDKILEDAYKDRESYKKKVFFSLSQKSEWLSSNWAGFKSPQQLSKIQPTGVDINVLKTLGKNINTIPESVHLHPNLRKIYDGRLEMFDKGVNVDWGAAEALAYGTVS